MRLKAIPVFFLFMIALFSGCGRAETGQDGPGTSARANARYTDDGRRIITIGTWYDRYYVSKHHDIHDDAGMADAATARMRLDKIRAVEQKYHVVLDYVNLTFDGVEESINASVPAGSPEVDIYEVDLQFGIPAVLKGYAVSLQEMGLQGTDVFGDQLAMKHLTISNQQESCLFAPSNTGAVNAYVLAFNMNLIKAAGLPNPQDLYDRGQWTWERWREYLKALTRDTDGDAIPDIYGYSGYWTHMLSALLLSNNAGIAPGKTEGLSSPQTRQVLEFINTVYNVDKTARPWDRSNWEINNRLYAEGLSGFWVGADWIFNEQGGPDLPFEIGVVPWPRGVGGSFEENRHSQPQGNWYLIPKGVEDPRFVYDVIYDWVNWYDGDLTHGMSTEWSRNLYMTDRNFQYARMMASKPGFDLWDSLDTGFNLVPLLCAEVSPDELVEEYRQPIQDALDNYFK